MALTVHESGTILQGENSRDLKTGNEPYEELNLIEPDGHYGYPYCYNFNAKVPEWAKNSSINCKGDKYQKPFVLMPPHVAPLDMFFYSGKMFPELKDHLIMTWHGYKPAGSRIVSYPVDEYGRPRLKSNPIWNFNIWDSTKPSGKSNVTADPTGGNLRAADHQELTTDWFAKSGLRPNGSVVGITEARDGSIWIVADYNKTVLRLSRGQEWIAQGAEAQGDAGKIKRSYTPEETQRILENLKNNPENLVRWNYIRDRVFAKNCTSCHSGMVLSDKNSKDPWAYLEYVLSRPGWLVPGKSSQSELYLRMSPPKSGASSGTPMPPSGFIPPKDLLTVKQFIDNLE
jgi:hypothetical protein